MTTEIPPKPVPRPERPELTKPFWDACKRHELVMMRCKKCSSFFFYPREVCPICLLPDHLEWAPVSGRGRLHSFTTIHQPAHPAFQREAPYIYAVIQLDEGVRMISNVVGLTREQMHSPSIIEMPVEVFFEDVTPEWTLPKFRPAKAG